jgi:hypothetical protein
LPVTLAEGDWLARLWPDGLRAGSLVEWLAVEEGCGATALALALARRACQGGKALVVIDRREEFYPPAVPEGIDLAATIVVQPANPADEVWAWDQALGSLGVGAVLGWVGAVSGRTFRRWQLSAARGGGLGLLVRSAEFRGAPSWAEARLVVRPLFSACGRRLQVEFLRGGGRQVDVEIDDETGALHLVAELAHPAAADRAAGA